MAANITFRLAEDNNQDCESFCRLSNTLYARPVDAAYYHWQFFQTPFPARLAFAMDRSGELAGCFGLHLRQTNQTTAPLAWVLDIMVSPRYQKQGVFRPLANFAAAQVRNDQPAALCAMANARSDSVFVHGMGWRRVLDLVHYVRSTGGGVPDCTRNCDFVPCDDFSPYEGLLAATDIRDTQYTNLLANRRTPSYLNWRFITNPRYRYHRFLVRRQELPFGYLILKVFRDPVSEATFGDIVDLSWTAADSEALTEILSFGLAHLREQGAPQAALWLQTNTLLDKAGMALGFMPTEQHRYFCCRILDERYRDLEYSKRWFLTMADSEVY